MSRIPPPRWSNRADYPIEICWYQLASLERLCDIDVGVSSAIQDWEDTRKFLGMEIIEATGDLGSSIRRRRLPQFAVALNREISALRLLSNEGSALLNVMDPVNARRGGIPTAGLADRDAEASVTIEVAVIGYALSCVCAGDGAAFNELLNMTGELSELDEFRKLQSVFSGNAITAENSHSLLCQYLRRCMVERDSVEPAELFVFQCQLLAWLRRTIFNEELASLLCKWVASEWDGISRNQTFKLRRPSSTVPKLATALQSNTHSSFARAASILLAAEEATGVQLDSTFRQILRSLLNG